MRKRRAPGARGEIRLASVLLLNLGGPRTTADVRPFLQSLFSDPMIIRLPGAGIFQPAFARIIAGLRERKVRGYYEQIGGGSPLLRLTEAQAHGLHAELARRGQGGDARVRVAMRYTEPRVERVVRAIRASGERRAVALPLYPQECRATTGSSLADLERARAQVAPDLEVVAIRSFHLHPGYLDAMTARIEEALTRLTEEERRRAVLLFSAHGVPAALPRAGDPYVGQIRETVTALLDRVGGGREHVLAFQSRTGPVRWVGPGTDEAIRRLAGSEAVVVVPVSFVSDHVETLFEIDILYAGLAREVGIKRFVRAGSLNDSPLFLRALADLVGPLLAER